MLVEIFKNLKYSGIFSFVVNNDQKVAKELYSLDAFSGRAQFPMFEMYEGEPFGLINSEGNLWEIHRRFTLRQLRDFGFGKNTMESLIMDEVHEMTEILKKKSGKPVGEVKEMFSLAVVNALWTVVGGIQRYFYLIANINYIILILIADTLSVMYVLRPNGNYRKAL